VTIRIAVLVSGPAALGGCTFRSDPPSEIVKAVEARGAGDLTAVSRQALEDWFRKHPDVTVETRKMCEPVRKVAPASWGDTTEGKVCAAAAVAGLFGVQELPKDDATFHGGAR
jgi:hypothetical protein